jgi:hypothetical protein
VEDAEELKNDVLRAVERAVGVQKNGSNGTNGS